MARASAVLVTRASQAQRLDELKATVRAAAPAVPIWTTDFAPSAVVQVGGSTSVEPSVLKGERVLAGSGNGKPESFRRPLAAGGGPGGGPFGLFGHPPYPPEELRGKPR